jgi:hypothetical protein
MEKRDMHAAFWWEILIERDRLDDVGINGKITLKCILMKLNGGLWTGFIWLRIKDKWWVLVNMVMNVQIL